MSGWLNSSSSEDKAQEVGGQLAGGASHCKVMGVAIRVVMLEATVGLRITDF